MKRFASEMVAKYRLKKAINSQGDKIYTGEFLAHNKRRIIALEQLCGCKECCLKIKTYYKSGKIESGFIFGIVDDIFSKQAGGEEYER